MARHPSRCLLPLVAALALQLTACSNGSPQATEKSSQSPSTTAPAATGPTASGAGSAPFSLREYDGPIDPGPHRLPLLSWERTYPVDALVRVPPGFITPGGWVIDNGRNGPAYGDLMFFGDISRDGVQTVRVPQHLAGALQLCFVASDDDDFGA